MDLGVSGETVATVWGAMSNYAAYSIYSITLLFYEIFTTTWYGIFLALGCFVRSLSWSRKTCNRQDFRTRQEQA